MSADTIFRYGDLERELVMTDYEHRERWGEAIKAFNANSTALNETDGDVAQLKHIVSSVRTFYDDMFGEGAAQEALGDTKDAAIAYDAARALIEFANSQDHAAADRFSQYLPNRAQRRAKEK